MKNLRYLPLILTIALLTGCTNTFAGSVLVLSFRDVILYVGIAFMFAVLIALSSNPEKRRAAFWLWFLLSIVITPLAGFIYLLVKITKKK